MSAANLKTFIANYTEDVWNHGRPEAIAKYHIEGYRHHDVSRPDVTTLADYTQWARELMAAFSSLHVAADQLLEEDGIAVKRWTVTGVHTGPLAGIAPTGKPVSFSGVSMYRFDASGRIAESWYVYDLFGLLSQVGAIPAPASA